MCMVHRSCFPLWCVAFAVLFTRLGAQVIPPGIYTGVIVGDTVNSSIIYVDPGASFASPTLTLTGSAGVYWRQIGTLAGKTISMGNGAYLYVSGANNALTLDSATTVTGDITIYSDGNPNTAIINQGMLTHNVGSGQMYASNFTNSGTITASGATYLYLGYPSAGYNSTNTGTITSSGTNTYVYLRGNFDNNGTVSAQSNGNLIWDGSNTTANLGTVTLSGGGRALLNGTLNNTATTLTAPTGGAFELYGGTITGGTIASGALSFTSSGGYLDGTTLTGDLSVGASTHVRLINNATFTGTNVSVGNSGGVYWQQTGTLANHTISLGAGSHFRTEGANSALTLTSGTVTMGSGAYFYASGTNSSLTFDAGTSLSGGVTAYSDSSAGTAITNQGTINHNTGTGSIYAANFTNSGTITASGATYLYLGYPSAGYNSTNTGTITSSGTNTFVYLRGNFDNNGTVSAQSNGNLIWDGSNTTANLGTVTLSGGGRALLNGTLDNTAATLTAPSGGTFELYGGTITGGTIASGALTFTNSGGTLSGTTLTGDLNVGAGAYVRLANSATFTGSNVSAGNSGGVYWQQTGTLANHTIALGTGSYFRNEGANSALTLASGTVTMGSGAYFYASGTNSSLTFDAGTSLSGGVSAYSDSSAGTAVTNQGTISHNTGSGSIYAANFTNSGSITASGATYLYLGHPSAGYNSTNTGTITSSGTNTYVYLRGNFDNNGTVSAQSNGNLIWDGSNTTANLGTVTLSGGGRALLNGTLNNTATTLTAPTGGAFELYGGTITGGTIASGALSFTSSGGYLDGTTLTGDLSVGASTHVRLINNATFTGTNVNVGNSGGVYWHQTGTLANHTISLGAGSHIRTDGANRSLTLTSGTVTMGSGAYFYASGTNSSLTFDATTTLSGGVSAYSDGSAGTAVTNQGTISHNTGSGSFYATNFTNSGTITASGATYLYLGYPSAGYNSTNTGTVTSSGTNTHVYLRGNFDNNGTVSAQSNGNLIWDGSNTTANLGTVTLSGGGRALLGGTLNNTAANLTAPTGGTFELYGGTITGGTIAAGALGFTSSGGYLDGATLTGDLSLGASSHVRFINGASFTGSNATLGANSTVYWQQVGTLNNKAITQAASSYFNVLGANNALTLATTTSVTGSIGIYSDSTNGTAITNQGTLTHNINSTGYLYADTFTNQGTVNVSAGSLYIGYYSNDTSTNSASGIVNLTGGNVYVSSPLTNAGLFNVQAGTLFTNNMFTNIAGGTFKGAGTVSGDVTISGGTVAPGNSIGTLTFAAGSDFTVTGSSVLEIELSGATADKIVFQNPGPVNIGSGLLQLSLSLLGAPVPYTTYTLLDITSGGSGIVGSLAGLPVTGSAFTAYYLGNPYDFHVTYLTNQLQIQAVPEPGTYALLGAGLVAVAFLRRRRRAV
jgi:hypothetical protein